jgi:uncharacterized membrane protein YfcA
VLGFFNGLLGGMTGLSGILVTIWCGMRGWSKEEQRSVYQPVILAAMAASVISLVGNGAITAEYIRLYLYGIPPLVIGLLIGFKLYGHLDDAAFRRIVLGLLLVSGIALVLPFH